ncbi:MAG: energy transducer TonB [Bacteroides sp.]|nr:energy transducer TonB [Bacteroides sp.]MCM1412875.1 energy transducer TonB [Bacteroides sp.]MCM1471544.1 energy transducer TonB [Bacteroides sp.]
MAKDVDLSSEEWRDLVFEGKNKDFGAYELRKNSPKRHNWAMVAVVVFILAVFLSSLLVSQVMKEEEQPKENKGQAEMVNYEEEAIEEEMPEEEAFEMPEEQIVTEEEVLSQEKVTEILIKPDDQVTEPPRSQDELQQSEVAAGAATVEGNSNDIIEAKAFVEEVKPEPPAPPAPPKHDDNKVFDSVEQDPVFPGGQAALLKYVADHLKYPPIAAENGIQGKVTVQFVVTKTGAVGQVKVVRGKDPELDKEAVRVVKSLPKFTPGKMNGHAVNVWYTLPITFRLAGQ